MPVRPRQTVEIPLVSVPTWLFESPEAPLSQEPVILDPADPDNRHLSLHSYRYWSQRLAAGLQDAGFGVGQRLLFLSGNSTAWPIVLMGTLMAGGVFSGQSPVMPIKKLVHQASGVQPAVIVASKEGYEMAREIARQIQMAEHYVFLFDDDFLFDKSDLKTIRSVRGKHHWSKLLKETSVPFDWRAYATFDQLAALNYTSGSTGDSKGVMVTHYNFVANAVQYIKQQSEDKRSPEQKSRLVWVMWTPMYHVIGFTQFCLISPKRGVINYIMAQFDLGTFLRYVEQYQANYIFLLPAILVAMLSLPAMGNIDLSKVHTVSFGGAPVRNSTIQRLRQLMPNKSLAIREAWGMTEMTAVAIFRSPLAPIDKGSLGELLPNCEGKIMTPDGQNELGVDEAGELYIRSPTVAKGYVNLPELSSKTFLPDGWLKTGDLATYNSEGNWHIKDRIQDIIYHENGSYALPTDLESGLLQITGVNDAGVTLIESTCDKERRVPRAFVVLDHTLESDVAKVAAVFRLRMKEHEQLRGGLYEIGEIPRLPSGKVDRVSLRNRQTG